MKTLITLLLLMVAATVNAQTTIPLAVRMDLTTCVVFQQKNHLAGDKVGSLIVWVKPFDVYKNTAGHYYVNTTTAKLVKKRIFLGYVLGEHTYNNNTIFYNADTTKCWIWTVDKYGQLLKMPMPDFLATDLKKKK